MAVTDEPTGGAPQQPRKAAGASWPLLTIGVAFLIFGIVNLGDAGGVTYLGLGVTCLVLARVFRSSPSDPERPADDDATGGPTGQP